MLSVSFIFATLTIAINTRLLLPNRLEGIGWFTFETFRRVCANHPEHNFLFIFDRPFDESFITSPNIKGVVVAPQARHPILYRIWFGWSVPRVLKKHNVDLFISPDGYLSLNTEVPQISVMHDLNFEHYREDLPAVHGNFYRKYFPRYARRATRIATVSEYSKQDIHACYGVDPDKIDVVYNGVGEIFSPADEHTKSSTQAEIAGGKPYFVFVGSLHPRKNVHRLLQAFDRFKKDTSSANKLVIVGEKFWWNGEMKDTYEAMKFQDEVIFTGRQNGPDLARIVACAQAMVFVPYFEGFGIPILEAFKSETPLITSNLTAMPEVAGDGAVLVDPFDIDQISSAMQQVHDDANLRERLVANGNRRLSEFSWDKTAELMWKSIEKVLTQIELK